MVIAVIVAAGKGLRMNNDIKKQYLFLKDMPILSHTLYAFDLCYLIEKIFLVIPEDDFNFCKEQIIAKLNLKKEINLVKGGKERQNSVYNALSAINASDDDMIVIHDGVRPLINPYKIKECIECAKETGAAILAVPVVDTIKHSNKSGYINKTISRENLWLAQTPQVFNFSIIKKAYDYAEKEKILFTDDSSIVEYMGGKVKIVLGVKQNIKITEKEDLKIADLIIGDYK